MPNMSMLEEKDLQWMQSTLAYSQPSAEDFEAELAAPREGREVPTKVDLTREQQVGRNREQQKQFEAMILKDLPSLSNEQLDILRINSFVAIASLELSPFFVESLDAWDKESVNDALRPHERIRRLAIDERRRRP